MTFREAFSVIWRQRIMILVVVVLAMAVAAVFLVQQTPNYLSTTTVRMGPVAASALQTGQIGTSPVDFDPEAVTTPAVLDAAAAIAGEPGSATGAWGVDYWIAAGGGEVPRITVTITARGTTAAQARERLEAVVAAYSQSLADQIADARSVAQDQAARWTDEAETRQAEVDRNPANSIAQSRLATAITALTGANETINRIDTTGPPLIVTSEATDGDFQGTGPLVALAVALVAGLIAGVGVALIWEALDTRLRPEDDILELTGVPALGELSLDKALRRGTDRLPAAGRARTTLQEGLRSLRTTLQVLLPSGSDAVVITSVEPGDGKTFISSNLALAWARMGRRVVLVGGDLRKGGLEEHFGDAATGPGLTELLQEAARSATAPQRAEIVKHLNDTEFPGLRILPSGAEPWDPADLLATDALGTIIARLRSLCDVIIIDSPPSLALVDARLLAAHADGVVVVASMRRTRRDPLVETVHNLTGSEITVLGVIANRSRRLIPKSYSEYYGTGRRLPVSVPGGPPTGLDEAVEVETPEAEVEASETVDASATSSEPNAVDRPAVSGAEPMPPAPPRRKPRPRPAAKDEQV